MSLWLIVSNLSLLGFRIVMLVGQAWSGSFTGLNEANEAENDEEMQNNQDKSIKFNWENAGRLKTLSTINTLVIFPFFVTWTIIGNMWIIESDETTPGCVSDSFSLL
jgi:hypothetical protein